MSNKTPVVVSVSDKYLWALQPFSELFNKYWGVDYRVYIAGYSVPMFQLPANFEFFQINTECYPKERWVDGIWKFLEKYYFEKFVLLLEDYWLCRKVDTAGIEHLSSYMDLHDNLLRMDLTADRQYAGGMKDIAYYEHFDIIEAYGSQYQMSLQAGIWDTRHFMTILNQLPPHMHSAWDVEIDGTSLVNVSSLRVFGTRQNPVRYVNGLNNAVSGVNLSGFKREDIEIVEKYIPSGMQRMEIK